MKQTNRSARLTALAVLGVCLASIGGALLFARANAPGDAVSTADRTVSASESRAERDDTSVPPSPLPKEETVTVTYVKATKAANIRAADSDDAAVIAALPAGSELPYVSESRSRYQITCEDGRNGWVPKNLCGKIEKEIVITHVPDFTAGQPIDMKGYHEGDALAAIFKQYHTVGASVAVIKDGQVCYHYEYGYANKAEKKKVTEATKFRIASVSKVFTAMLAMKQSDDGLLDLDRDIGEILGYRVGHPAFPQQPVTTRMLLTHTAGLVDRKDMYRQPLRELLSNRRYYNSKPGTSFLYSNLSMGTAGAVLEKSAGQTVSEYARDAFLAPMGLDASFDAQYLSDKSLVADCYENGAIACDNKFLTRNQTVGTPGTTFHLTAGGLLISAEDLASLMTLLINDGQYNGTRYLSQAALDEMLAKQCETKQNFTQCIGIRKMNNLVSERDMYYHNGNAYGIHSLIALDPADRSGVAVITSGSYPTRRDNTLFAVCDDVLACCYDSVLSADAD